MRLRKIAWRSMNPGDPGLQIVNELRRSGAVIVSDLPDEPHERALLALAQAIGTVRKQALLGASKGTYVFPIHVRQIPLKTPLGRDVASHSNGYFDWHTDEFFTLDPADIVLLHCVRPDRDGGGASLLCHIDDVTRKLKSDQLKKLQQPIYPHARGQANILQRQDGGWLIRYNRMLIQEEAGKQQKTIHPEAQCALSALDAAIECSRKEIALSAGDCLIVDNLRVLHGRRAFNPKSTRLLKRVRVMREGSPKFTAVLPG
jgi:alpha-ketoglutarate-dependent taurine dioxygenase